MIIIILELELLNDIIDPVSKALFNILPVNFTIRNLNLAISYNGRNRFYVLAKDVFLLVP